jgi:hypothetical protein
MAGNGGGFCHRFGVLSTSGHRPRFVALARESVAVYKPPMSIIGRFALSCTLFLASSSAYASTAAPFGADECSGCALLGALAVELASIEPAAPVVGDLVAFTFNVEQRLPFGIACCGVLVGGDPFLEGDEPTMPAPDGIRVQRRAALPGVATVELILSATTEKECFFIDPIRGCTSYFDLAQIEASSGPVSIQITAPTPSATPTPTPTPTRSPSTDDDGCAIARPTHSAAALLLVLPALLLAMFRPHSLSREGPVRERVRVRAMRLIRLFPIVRAGGIFDRPHPGPLPHGLLTGEGAAQRPFSRVT